MPGDENEVIDPETLEIDPNAEVQEEVLSNKDGEVEDPPKQVPAKPKGKPDHDAGRRRIERSQLQAQLSEALTATVSPDDVAAVEALARSEGYDLKEESTLKQVQFFARAASLINGRRQQLAQALVETPKAEAIRASREILGATLTELGYKPGTPKFFAAGEFLFKSHGNENPERFTDKGEVEEKLKELFGSSNKPSVKNALINRAGAPKGNSEPKGSRMSSEGETAEVKSMVDRMGISPEAAKIILNANKNKKLPSFMR